MRSQLDTVTKTDSRSMHTDTKPVTCPVLPAPACICSWQVGCYKEMFRVLKPGQCFAGYEWCLTDAYDPNNPDHTAAKAEVELGNGLPDIRSTKAVVEALEKAGFEVRGRARERNQE